MMPQSHPFRMPPDRARLAQLATIVVLGAALGLVAGCNKKKDRPPAPSPSTTSAPPGEMPGHGMAGHDLAGHDAGAAPSDAHQDHDGKHGGLVQMFGDLHTEMVFDPAGKHRLYVSDASRQPLPPTTVSKVTFTVKRPGADPEKLTLMAMEDHWMATGAPLDNPKAMVRLDFVYQGKAQFIDVPALTVAAVPEAGHEHAEPGEGHAHSSPHGGIVVSIEGGHLELVAGRDGKFQLWLLDDKLGVRPVAGATGTLKLALSGYREVSLAVVGDHLEGSGAAITKEHATAVASVTQGGKTDTARFSLHLEAGGEQH